LSGDVIEKSVFGPFGIRNFERKGMGFFISICAETKKRSWPAAKRTVNIVTGKYIVLLLLEFRKLESAKTKVKMLETRENEVKRGKGNKKQDRRNWDESGGLEGIYGRPLSRRTMAVRG
jgi:hypothetical protein